MKVMTLLSICFVFFMLSLESLADSQNVDMIWRDPYGQCEGLYIKDNYAYLGFGGSFLIIDVSDPIKPTKVGSILTIGIIKDVQIVNSKAYVLTEDDGLYIMDVSDPANPSEVGNFSKLKYAYNVQMAGDFAYVCDNVGLHIIDVSHPISPKEISTYLGVNASYGIAVSGKYAYITNLELCIIDISDPKKPHQVGFLGTSGEAAGIQIVGNYAYIRDYKNGLLAVDITDPTSPTKLWNFSVGIRNFYVIGNYAYVTDYTTIYVLDISNPKEFKKVTRYTTNANYITQIRVSNGIAYLAYFSPELYLVDISNLANIHEVGIYKANRYTSTTAVYVSGNYAYVADGVGVRILDISDPANPKEVSFCEVSAGSIFVANGYIYTGGYIPNVGNGFNIIDASNPEKPVIISYIQCISPYGIKVIGNYAYIANGQEGLLIADVSNLKEPKNVSSYKTSDYAMDIYVAGKYAYIADGEKGLTIIDVSNSKSPKKVNSCDTPGWSHGIYVAGNYAYLIDWGLQIIDISDPKRPKIVGSHSMRTADKVCVVGNCAYVVDNWDGLRVIDVSDPKNPTETGYWDTPGYPEGVFISKGYAYVADRWDGLWILKYTGDCKEKPIAVENEPEIPKTTNSVSYYPETDMLLQNYPNPCNPVTWIPYQIKEGANVEIVIYTSAGFMVRTLDLGYKQPGFYVNERKSAYWDGKNDEGENVASGVYFYTIKAGVFSSARKMVIRR